MILRKQMRRILRMRMIKLISGKSRNNLCRRKINKVIFYIKPLKKVKNPIVRSPL
jgi:hypothetical protein